MKRPTAQDLAKAAGVGLSTVDRVMNGRARVRPATAQRVLDAAERIGFYGEGTIRARVMPRRPTCNLGFLLLQKANPFYDNLAHELKAAAAAFEAARVNIEIDYITDLSPEIVARKILTLGRRCDVAGIVATQHLAIANAIETLREAGVPTFGLLSELSAQCSVGYVGWDNWKVGRTAGWALTNLIKSPGKIGVFVGNHRFRCQELHEIGFRAYLRENAPAFEILEPQTTLEDNAIAERLTRELLAREPGLKGLYVAGGGLDGVLAAMRDAGAAHVPVTVGYQNTDNSRLALSLGLMHFVISHPVKLIARESIIAMTGAANHGPQNLLPSITVPMDLYTPENI